MRRACGGGLICCIGGGRLPLPETAQRLARGSGLNAPFAAPCCVLVSTSYTKQAADGSTAAACPAAGAPLCTQPLLPSSPVLPPAASSRHTRYSSRSSRHHSSSYLSGFTPSWASMHLRALPVHKLGMRLVLHSDAPDVCLQLLLAGILLLPLHRCLACTIVTILPCICNALSQRCQHSVCCVDEW